MKYINYLEGQISDGASGKIKKIKNPGVEERVLSFV